MMIRVSLIALALFVPLQSAAVAGTYACKVWCEGRGGVVRARLGSIDVQAPDSGAAQEAAKQQIENTCQSYGFHGPTPQDGGRAAPYASCWSK
jgi:hypothetical protein